MHKIRYKLVTVHTHTHHSPHILITHHTYSPSPHIMGTVYLSGTSRYTSPPIWLLLPALVFLMAAFMLTTSPTEGGREGW